MNKIIFLSGPTAVGKTDFSLELSEHIAVQTSTRCEIVNFDSLLFYQELDIGTAKPPLSALKKTPHHLVNIRSIKDKPINAFMFCQMAERAIASIFRRRHIPLLVGGSGFYLRALVKGMIPSQTVPRTTKQSVLRKNSISPIDFFLDYLKKHDPDSLKDLHKNDHYRIMRACEHHQMTGRPFSQDKKAKDNQYPYDFSKNVRSHWDFLHIYLDVSKEDHDVMIKKRAHSMIHNGLLDEVRELETKGRQYPVRFVGYKEVISYFDGKIKSKEELIERIHISTRQLAKSQRTFFKKIRPKFVFNPTVDKGHIKNTTLNFIRT